jgi:hypothetical protein
MSSDSSVNSALAEYAAGRMPAQQLVGVVAAAYYGDGGRGTRDGLKPVMDVIERAHPGVVELTSASDKPGFSMRLAERPFPKRYEGELREAVQIVVGAQHAAPLHHPATSVIPAPGILSRLIGAVRRLFSAST